LTPKYFPVDRFVPLSQQLVDQRNQLFKELHALIAHQVGADGSAIAVRFGQLLTLLLELGVKAMEII
jgi:hypothetical protein